MKALLRLLILLLVPLTQGFGQEPKRIAAKPSPGAESRQQTVASGAPQRPAPMVQPKALPQLSPTLGDIAREARAAHAAAAKAHVVLDPEADAVTSPPEEGAALKNEPADPGQRACRTSDVKTISIAVERRPVRCLSRLALLLTP